MSSWCLWQWWPDENKFSYRPSMTATLDSSLQYTSLKPHVKMTLALGTVHKDTKETVSTSENGTLHVFNNILLGFLIFIATSPQVCVHVYM